MSNTSISFLTGNCIPPFLDASRFPQTGGFIDGRFCAPIAELPGSPTCCLPCPITDWTYPDSFKTYSVVADWLNVAGLALMTFMLLSYLVLPTQKTRSHYLSVCLIVSVMMMALGFTIPLAARPDQCHDAITPNDMFSSTECAWSGAFLIAGGLSANMWIFIRALSMNLQICWDIVPGRRFFYLSQAAGWGVPAAFFTATMTATGVSFRFGTTCHVNHDNSMADFWGPLLAIVAAAGLLQLVTFAYCTRVYLKNLLTDRAGRDEQPPPSSTTNASSSGGGVGGAVGPSHLPSYSNSVRTAKTARAVWRRLQKVLWLQWRGICIVTIILVDVVFFCIVFVRLDHMQTSIKTDIDKLQPWLECLALDPTDKARCLPLVGRWLVGEQTVVAVLLLLSLAGLQVFIFLTRPSIFPAWADLLRSKFGSRSEFVSLDARPDVMMRSNPKHHLIGYARGHHENDGKNNNNNSTFEMQKPGAAAAAMHLDLDSKTLMSPTHTILSSPDDAYRSPLLHVGRETPVVAASADAEATYYNYNNNNNNSNGTTNTLRHSAGSSTIGRGRIAPEHLARLHGGSDAAFATSPPLPDAFPGSPPTPVVRYDAVSLYRQNSDYFTTGPRGVAATAIATRAPSISSMNSERRYQAPHLSFSAPLSPSPRPGSSARAVSFADSNHNPGDRGGGGGGGGGGGWERDGAQSSYYYGRGGLGLNPPSEMGEEEQEESGNVNGNEEGRYLPQGRDHNHWRI